MLTQRYTPVNKLLSLIGVRFAPLYFDTPKGTLTLDGPDQRTIRSLLEGYPFVEGTRAFPATTMGAITFIRHRCPSFGYSEALTILEMIQDK